MSQIKGYRELTAEQISDINMVKDVAERVGAMVSSMQEMGDLDQRWVSIGKTHLQEGFMFLARAVAQPTTF